MGDTDDVRAIIAEVDKNGDGMIDYEEFQHILRENVRGLPSGPRGA
jgi:Ca2+-binding EF-hand superfamily protein